MFCRMFIWSFWFCISFVPKNLILHLYAVQFFLKFRMFYYVIQHVCLLFNDVLHAVQIFLVFFGKKFITFYSVSCACICFSCLCISFLNVFYDFYLRKNVDFSSTFFFYIIIFLDNFFSWISRISFRNIFYDVYLRKNLDFSFKFYWNYHILRHFFCMNVSIIISWSFVTHFFKFYLCSCNFF